MNRQDIKVALQAMSFVAGVFLLRAVTIIAIAASVVAVSALAGYIVVHWPWQSGTVVVMAMLCAWFMIEMDTARFDRERQEREDEWHKQMQRPSHGD